MDAKGKMCLRECDWAELNERLNGWASERGMDILENNAYNAFFAPNPYTEEYIYRIECTHTHTHAHDKNVNVKMMNVNDGKRSALKRIFFKEHNM